MHVSYIKALSSYGCFFIYSRIAFSVSSLTFLAEPVLFTTYLIQSCHVCLSMFIEVLAFSRLLLIKQISGIMVNKVGGIYHKLLIPIPHMVMWYNGNGHRLC